MPSPLIQTYQPLPIHFTHGKGCWLFGNDGNTYLDALGGIAVCGLGHAHPEITQAICEQAQRLIHVSNLFEIPEQLALAEKLIQVSGMEQVFISNTGAEANEAALKLTRLFAHQKNIAHPHIIAMEKSFHGRTLATLSASGSPKTRAGYEPYVPGFLHVPFNDFSAIEKYAAQNSNIVAIIVEPIQGEGGIRPAEKDYLIKLRQLCDENNWLLIIDEVQTGNGRTGKWYAYQHHPIKPDILTTAKALGNGIPIAACLVRDKAMNLFKPGNHGSTLGGNPFACKVALTVLNTLEKLNAINNAAEMGNYLLQGLRKALSHRSYIKEIRGQGLLIGIELDHPCRDLLHHGLKQRILFSVTAESVIRLAPALIITQDEADQIIQRLVASIDSYYSIK